MDKKRSDKKRPDNKHKRLRTLACYDEMHSKVLQGYPLTEVASWIQDEMQESVDVTKESLVTMLTRYRQDLKPVEVKSYMSPALIAKADKELSEGINELSEIEKLYVLQMERIGMGHKFEKMTNVLNKMLGGEIMRASDLLMRHHNLKMDLGFNGGRNLGSLTIRPELEMEILGQHGEEAHRASKSVEAGSRVLSIAKTLAELELLTEEEFIDIEEH